MPRRVVITGLGAVTAPGVGFYPLWEAMVSGRSGLGVLTRVDASGFRARFGGEIKDFAAKDHVPKSYRKAVKVMARDTEIAVGAARAAVEDAGLVTRAHADGGTAATTYPSERVGCHIGAGLIAAETLELTTALATAAKPGFSIRDWGTVEAGGTSPAGGMNNLQPLWMLKYLPNMLACHVTIIHGCEGPSNTITCAEASGLLSLGESRRVIERGDAEVCFSGGAESKVSLMGLLRYELAGRLADTAGLSDPSAVLRPYDPASTGTLVGEGGAILVLEEQGAAAKRGAKVYAEIVGFGAAHSSPPCIPPLPPAGPGACNDGVELAIRAALRDAKIGPEAIDALVPQACGVAAIDAGELGALRRVFGERLSRLPMVTTTPCVGDLAAGNAAVQAAVAANCLRAQQLPARLHAGTPVPGALAGAARATDASLTHVLVVTGSLTGQNAAMVLKRAG
jgi:3-oxoacyl-[acyl-carrier-protein] synthase II